MGTPYRVCEHCGAHLDANEKCDCRNPKQEEAAAEARPMKLVAVCRVVDKLVREKMLALRGRAEE
jgi:hypothetical protein